MVKSANFSKDRKYRYSLTRIWDKSKSSICFIGLNPSIADEKEDDMTIKKCINFSKQWGYGGFHMINLFSLVATYPEDLYKAKEPVGKENDKYIKEKLKKVNKVICMWGNKGVYLNRNIEVLKLISNPYCLKKNVTGEPTHIGRLGYDYKPIKY